LGFALPGLLLLLLFAVAMQAFALRRLDRAVDSIERGDRLMRLTLELEDALRDQAHFEIAPALGNGPRSPGEEGARHRTLSLLDELEVFSLRNEAVPELEAVRSATAELDRALRMGAPSKSLDRPGPAATPVLDFHTAWDSRLNGDMDETLDRLEAAILSSRGDIYGLERTYTQVLVSMLIVTAVLVVLAIAYFARSVARPLALLSQGAAVLGSGNLDARISLDSRDEFGDLAAELNALAAALKEHQTRLVESENLAGVGRGAAGFAHEIKNSLQVLLGYLSLNRDVADPLLAEQLAVVEEETRRCQQVVESMLELARPRQPLTFHSVDLRMLCEDVLEKVKPLAQPAGVSLVVSGSAIANADRPKLRQAVFNLVKNAVEAAGPRGEVRVCVSQVEGNARVAVSDTGPGVPADQRTRLFEPFFTTKTSGTGLGLAVSRAIARVHGGDIDLLCEETKGAHFVLRLPGPTAGSA
jgi:signal transduction histidine kinase